MTMDVFSLAQVNYTVMARHHLTAASREAGISLNPADGEDFMKDAGAISRQIARITGDIAGLHATGSTTPFLSLLARMAGFQLDFLIDALYQDRELAKIRCVRKTIYIQPRDMLPVVFAATSAKVIAASERYMSFRGVPAGDFQTLSRKIVEMLAGTAMTAQAIKTALHADVDISAVLYTLCDQGILVRDRPVRGWQDKNHHYSLFQEAFPGVDLRSITEDEAVVALVRYYLAAFGPATETDLAWWTGLGKKKIGQALLLLRDEVRHIEMEGYRRPGLVLAKEYARFVTAGGSDGPVVNLLPWLDPYLMGYAERQRYLDPALRDWVFDRSGNVTATILVDGRVDGVWDFDPIIPMVKLHYLVPVAGQIHDEIIGQARRLGRFMAGIDEDVAVGLCDEMIPLTRRTAGSFMVPLKGCDTRIVA